METIGERVKRIREKRDIGQTELAARVSMSPQAIWNLENGIVGKTFCKLPALAKALGCRIDDLFPEMDDPRINPIYITEMSWWYDSMYDESAEEDND